MLLGKQISIFLTSWKIANFFLQMFVIFNKIPDSCLVEKGGILEGGTSTKPIRLKLSG